MERVKDQRRRRDTILCTLAMLAVPQVGACGSLEEDVDFREIAEPLAEDSRGEVVYSYVRVYDSVDAGEPSLIVEDGEVSNFLLQRAGRPYSYLDEEFLYHAEAWETALPDGSIERGYRIWRSENPSPDVPVATSDLPFLEESLEEILSAAEFEGEQDATRVHVTLRNFPNWDIPLLPEVSALAAVDVEAAYEERAEAFVSRAATFDEMALGIVTEIESGGGTVTKKGKSSGWLIASVSRAGLQALSARTDILRIADGRWTPEELDWRLGEGRWDERLDVDRFHTAGYTGERTNPSRHGFGDITVAIIERFGYEDEACFFYDGAGCTGASRIQAKYICDGPAGDECQSDTSFPDNDVDDWHGTRIASILAGDYEQGQANGQAVGDSWLASVCNLNAQCASNICEVGLCAHTPQWEERASGMAPEARLVLIGDIAGQADELAAYADAFEDTIDEHVDIVSTSFAIGKKCDPIADQAHELG